MKRSFAEQLESEFHVHAKPVIGKQHHSVCRRWLTKYCPNVKLRTGKWEYNGYWWHAYSFNFETAIVGDQAFEHYQSMPIEPFFMYHESDDLLYDCSAIHWPDIRSIEDDIHVLPHTMKWTFLTTHETSIGLGPYFALPPI